ncbi:MAG: phenylalanine--tRNA ligase subunit beta [Bacteriovoracia bacterium]
MKISYQWLKEYVSLPPEATPQEIAHRLTFAGLEVEALESLAKGLEKVVVGQILERKQHPNADRLSLTVIDVGGPAKLEIVCGAQNIAAGQKIPVAMIGAHLPNGMDIKAAKIRNVASSGMLCSLDELMLPKEWQSEDGIYQLDSAAKVGMPFADYLGRDDWIFEVNVTANRGDALSHMGIAREVAALFGQTTKYPEGKVQETAGERISATITNTAGKEACPRYFGRVIEGVKIGPSPDWLRKRLEAIGARSINNVVDVTAFVMFEMGQPLHAFDADKLRAGKDSIAITVRDAAEGEKFKTLADKEVSLKAGDIVIAAGADAHAVALAGVIGGKNSEVDDSTTNIFLEAAEFHPVRVRKTGRRLATLTDAGYRFERGVDTGRIAWAADRASELIAKVAGGQVRKLVSAAGSSDEEPRQQIRLRLSDLQKTLGKSPELQTVIQILRGLGIPAESAAGEQGVVSVQIPRWRKDLKRTIDLVEEVARIWGFDHLESKLPLGGVGEAEGTNSRRNSYFQVRRVRRHLASLGFFEALNYAFTSEEILRKAHSEEELKATVEIANPVTSDFSVLKPSLVTGLLQNVVHNFAHGSRDLRLFEVRRSFARAEKPNSPDPRLDTGVKEDTQIALLLTGSEVDEFWQGKASSVDYYSIKGALESIFEMLSLGGVQFQPGTDRGFLHPGQSATVIVAGKPAGYVGRLHPRVEKNFEFGQDVFFAEIRLDALISDEKRTLLFKEFSNFPLVERDFSVLVKDSVNAQMIRGLVTKLAKPLLRNFHFFDVYKGSRVPEGHTSYAFRIELGANDHTLADAEITAVQEKIMKELEKELQAKFAGLN